MEMTVERRPTVLSRRGPTTFGDWRIEGLFFCYTLEDEIRKAKVYGETAIPPFLGVREARYELGFVNSPKFGPMTIAVLEVPGYDEIRVHGGIDIGSTLGCIIVGDVIDEVNGTIAGARVRGVLNALKEKVRKPLLAGDRVWLTVKNPREIST